MVTLASGETRSALEIQEQYWEAAHKYFAGQDDESDWVLEQWESVLCDLRKDYTRLVGRVDWASKLWLLESFREAENLTWEDPWLKSLDLEYHNVDAQKGVIFWVDGRGACPQSDDRHGD